MALEQELKTFEDLRSELVRIHPSKFTMVKGEEFLGAFDNLENAYTEGVKRFGNQPFLVKRIVAVDEAYRNHALFSGLINGTSTTIFQSRRRWLVTP